MATDTKRQSTSAVNLPVQSLARKLEDPVVESYGPHVDSDNAHVSVDSKKKQRDDSESELNLDTSPQPIPLTCEQIAQKTFWSRCDKDFLLDTERNNPLVYVKKLEAFKSNVSKFVSTYAYDERYHLVIHGCYHVGNGSDMIQKEKELISKYSDHVEQYAESKRCPKCLHILLTILRRSSESDKWYEQFYVPTTCLDLLCDLPPTFKIMSSYFTRECPIQIIHISNSDEILDKIIRSEKVQMMLYNVGEQMEIAEGKKSSLSTFKEKIEHLAKQDPETLTHFHFIEATKMVLVRRYFQPHLANAILELYYAQRQSMLSKVTQ